VAFEDLGVLADLFARRGDKVAYYEAQEADFSDAALQDADLLVVLGGPVGAYDDALYPFVAAEAECIGRRLASGKPILGVCLGAQLMARMLGAEVVPMATKEIGFSPLILTEAGRRSPLRHLENIPVLHWHGDRYVLPAGAVRPFDEHPGAFRVRGDHDEYIVRTDPPSCTCPWWRGHTGSRGVCKHILAAELSRTPSEPD